MPNTLPIEGERMVRDGHSKGVMSTNMSALQAYKEKKKLAVSKEQRINNLEDDVSEIKNMLKQLLEGQK